MIPVKITDYARRKMITNVIRTWESATADQMATGRAWYPSAHALAVEIAPDPATGAGVIASLSANKSWSENVKLARIAFATGTPVKHVADALRKASRIMDGVPPEMLLPMTKKTGHFYRCILDPMDAEAVCIDRHAHDIAVGERYGERDRGLSSQGRYDTFADVYRAAARRLGELPQVVQAVTWTVQVESK